MGGTVEHQTVRSAIPGMNADQHDRGDKIRVLQHIPRQQDRAVTQTVEPLADIGINCFLRGYRFHYC